jgi:hypothetical protein
MASYLVVSQTPLKPLDDLDKTSPQFHEQLSNFLSGTVYQNLVPSLQSEGLTWLVEYLDTVRLKITLLRAMLISA